MIHNDDSFRKVVFSCFKSLLEKYNDIKPVICLVENCLQNMVSKDINSPDYESYLKVFGELIEYQSPEIIGFLKEKLFEEPQEKYKMDIVTKYASSLSI